MTTIHPDLLTETGTLPTTGQVLTASSATAAAWSNPSSSFTSDVNISLVNAYLHLTDTSGTGTTGITLNGVSVLDLVATSGITRINDGGSGGLQINSTGVSFTGNIVLVNGVPTSFPVAQGAATTVLTNDGAGNLSWATTGGGGSPSGPATGDLSGTYPFPAVAKLGTTGASVVVNTAAPPTIGQVLTATSPTAADWETPTGGGGGGWTKYTVTYTSLATAATTNDIALFTLVAGGIVEGVKIKHSASFTGGSISAYTVSVGITGDLAKYASNFDVFQVPSSTTMQLSQNFFTEDQTSTTSVRIAATSAGANLSAATAGSVDVWVKTSAAI